MNDDKELQQNEAIKSEHIKIAYPPQQSISTLTEAHEANTLILEPNKKKEPIEIITK